jgi:hypothetical protein
MAPVSGRGGRRTYPDRMPRKLDGIFKKDCFPTNVGLMSYNCRTYAAENLQLRVGSNECCLGESTPDRH